ncbi:SDR family NAD(P)-dependent oxidoreductase [Nocardioides yefusunii]|uniref:SDR family NAD(P)-dependent oxidoreductase n=1 Tax=Nocardioides yefusunii TaxID=2500546 RepID=A0ABW1QUQ0_9ACTN|nr:SDR family NAD(P)-dependent oxidoreductase [Nocardioides yefusunii]
MRTFSDKVVAITGAASGIGRALAVEVSRRGAHVALADVDADGLEVTRKLAHAAGARGTLTTVLDVTSAQALRSWADEVVEQFGRVNAVVNNAGVSLTGDLTDLDDADMEWIMSINFWGVVHGTRAFLPHLIASGDGHVVNVSSLFGLVSMPGQSLYNASKYAVRGASEALREEMLVARHPVQVSVVHPGGIRTGIARNGRFATGVDGAETAAKFDTRLARTTPEKAARTIVAGVLKHRPRILVGPDAHVVHVLSTLAGARYQDVAARVSARTGF